jgi:acyl-CoA synthetase (NDP forming)/GNAT superfamily N-acetyltransferase
MSEDTGPSTYALLTDGTTIEIRPARPGDFDAVRDMHAAMSRENLYLRFFGVNRAAAEQEARRICRAPAPDHAALLAVLDGQVIGCGSYEIVDERLRTAEIALAVADDMHKRGIGTLLLEHLVSLAHGRGLRTFVAETLTDNTTMLQVFASAGLHAQAALADGMYELRFPLQASAGAAHLDAYRNVVAERERSADVASLRHVLTPASVAVVGAGRRPGSVGRAILDNIISGGFPGPVYAVNPGAAKVGGVPCVPTAADLPEPVDLAVIAVPPGAVTGVAEDCGRRGVRALVVTTAGLDGTVRAQLLGICRRHGMRLVGPTCFGIANTAISLNATFADRHPKSGIAGLALQSGGVGIVLIEHLSRLGIGISSFVSLGDKEDVSGNDMLLWWKSDAATKLAVLYLDSFGNPRKFARTARAVSRAMPILTVNAGRSAAGLRLAAIRAGAAATPQLTRQALFQQAGVIATANLGELLDVTALLASQPVPAGTCVGVVGNTRGGGVLAADACSDAGLQVACLARETQRALRDLLPPSASVAGPVDTSAVLAPGTFRRCLELVGADPHVDAVLAVTITTATSDLVSEVAAARPPVPIAAAVMDQLEAVRLLPRPDEAATAVPAYAYPESAARALGHAARYGRWRKRAPGAVPDIEGLRQDRAKEVVASYLAGTTQGGWLPREQLTELLGCYGVPRAGRPAVTMTDGVELKVNVLQERVFGPVVLFGLAGATDVLAGRAARLAPLTDTDADALIRSVRAAPLPLSRPDAPGAGLVSLKDMLLRVSQLANDLPQVAELELSPVMASPDGAVAVGARVRIQAADPVDAYLRQLR